MIGIRILNKLGLGLWILALASGACTTIPEGDEPYGVALNRAGYIPARMALVPCMPWPDRASRMQNQPLNTASKAESAKLCAALDAFVAAGFENQPFMNGLSSSYVEKLYKNLQSTLSVSAAIALQWQADPKDCAQCRSVTSFYKTSISSRREWTVWLTQFAKVTKGTDAVLIPLIIHFGVKTENERGLLVAKRSAHVALLLVDTNSGDLIWSGGREAEVVAKAFAEDPQAKDLQAPSQEELQQRLLTNALWLMFPGRQVYK